MYVDPIRNEFRNENLLKLKSSIENYMNYADGDLPCEELLEKITLSDVDRYLRKICTDRQWDFKRPLVRSATIRDRETFESLCDYTNIDITNIDFPDRGKQNIYFIESADFAITLIPIQLEDGVNAYMEALDSSPDFITEIYQNLNDKRKELDRIEFVRFNIDKSEDTL